MPKTYRKNKKIHRRYPTRRSKAKIPMTLGAFPNTKVASLRYCDRITMNPGIGTWASYLFRANSCYDPDVTGVGHQPMGYDQWGNLYTHATILGSKMTVQVGYRGAVDQSPLMVVTRLQRDTVTTAVQTVGEIMETARSKYISYANYYATGALSRKISQTFSAKDFFNVTDVKDNQQNLGSATNANPTEGAFYAIYLRSLDPAWDATLVDVLVTIDYIVSFAEPVVQAQS